MKKLIITFLLIIGLVTPKAVVADSNFDNEGKDLLLFFVVPAVGIAILVMVVKYLAKKYCFPEEEALQKLPKNLNIKNEAELIAAIRLLFPEYSNVTNANIEERVKEVKAIIPLYEILEKIFPNAEKRYGISYGIIDFLYNPEKKNLLVELISESTNPKQLYENIVYSFGNVKGLNEPASYEDLESYKNAQEEKLIPIDMEFTDFKRDLMAFKSENPKSTSEDYLDALEIKRLLETAYDIPTEEHPEEKPFEEPGSAQQISAQAVQGSAATHPAAPELSEMRTLPETEQSSLYNLLFEKGEVSLPEDVSAIQRAMEEAQIEQTSRTALEEDVH